MRKLNKREMVLLSIFIIFILVALIVNSWLPSYLDNRNKLVLEREQLQSQWEEISQYINREAEIRNSISQLNEENDKFRQMVPDGNSSHKYWETILKRAKESSVEVIAIQEGEKVAEEKTMNTTVSIQGSFEGTMDFIENMNSLPYLYALKEGRLTEVEGGKFLTTLSLDFYFLE